MIPVTPLDIERPSALATEISERLNAAIREHLLAAFAPDNTKTLRKFAAPEVAELLGVSGQFMRKVHSEGTVPEPDDIRGGRRYYTAQEIWDAREILERTSRKKGRYVPRRSAEEKLHALEAESDRAKQERHVGKHVARIERRLDHEPVRHEKDRREKSRNAEDASAQ